MNEKYYNYNDLEQMQEKAKKIDSESDKKNFLREMNPLEQKMALFSTKRPYDIINYLNSFDYKETNMMLNELTNEEILQLLELFTAEDKKNFYSTFSNSMLVNKFIANDKQAFTHVDELDLERKIELLDSSKKDTQEASKEIYNSLSVDEKELVEDKITTLEGSLAIENIIQTSENNVENDLIVEAEKLQEPEIVKEELQQEEQQESKEKEKPKDVQEEQLQEMNEFLKSRLEHYKKENPEFETIDINNPNLFISLSDKLKEFVINDFNLIKKEQKNKLDQQDLLQEFQKSKENCEIEIINSIKPEELETKEEVVNEEQGFVKTL